MHKNMQMGKLSTRIERSLDACNTWKVDNEINPNGGATQHTWGAEMCKSRVLDSARLDVDFFKKNVAKQH
ncbi:hypothetical protein ACHAC9_08505 [Massilia sp. CMS3.1]|uniref:hypothetical protein n=1 Tax=Massilia sp. CMS3.1 TaxID=3373083 RepID=UPI003EE4CD1C